MTKFPFLFPFKCPLEVIGGVPIAAIPVDMNIESEKGCRGKEINYGLINVGIEIFLSVINPCSSDQCQVSEVVSDTHWLCP
jgi:hypothetical protein